MTGEPHRRSIAAAFLVALLVTTGGAPAAEPTAGEIWFQFRDAYVGLAAYHDTGDLERIDAAGRARVRFRTDRESDGELRFSYQPEGGEPGSLTGRRAGSARSSSLAPSLDQTFGAGASEALAVPVLLSAGALAGAEPEALALDGIEPCAEGSAERCHVLAGARTEAGISFRLWVGERDHLLRRSEVELARGEERRTYRVSLLPVVEQRVEREVFSETVTVALSSIDARVIDDHGKAVTGLTAADFRLRLGRDELRIEAVEWVGAVTPDPEALASAAPPELDGAADDWEETAPPAPRLVLFFVQANLDPQRRTTEMKMRGAVESFVGGLPLMDRAAVVSYDSHLKLRLDFTDDRGAIREAIDAAWRTGPAPPPDRSAKRRRMSRGGEPSLAEALDPAAAKNASSPERALELAARALVPLSGDKVVVYLGWGLGELGSSGVIMPTEYSAAVRALGEARASVFVLDTSDSAYHSLELGLQQVAEDTGGTYAKTNEFPALATAELEQAIAGHYLVYFSLPEGARPDRLRLELRESFHRELLVRGYSIR